MFTVLAKSASLKRLTSFRTHKWKSSNTIQNDSTNTFWRVRTNFRLETFIEYLKLKLLYSIPSEFELRFILDLDPILNDPIVFAAFKAKQLGFKSEQVFTRMNTLNRLFDKKELTENLFFTLEGTIKYELEECRQSIRPAKKFSGYIRNSSAVGSKRRSGLIKPDPEISEWFRAVEYDWFTYITVGEFSSGQPESAFFTLKSTKSAKRSSDKKFNI